MIGYCRVDYYELIRNPVRIRPKNFCKLST